MTVSTPRKIKSCTVGLKDHGEGNEYIHEGSASEAEVVRKQSIFVQSTISELMERYGAERAMVEKILEKVVNIFLRVQFCSSFLS